ncbi:MAG: helix-turn-helix transcriptional regulator [Coriobacteriia bacterium]|nr:helix-turn-helix transcriptional regulator [Coriobacteriia bacterium]
MSFRDNLQHLRAMRNMTQEQLAMLLGVSRQSVTKWEAEKASPEMDKLLAICDIFGCTLDDLVRGDLSTRPAEPCPQMVQATGPVHDVCGYDEHARRFALQVPTGVALCIAGFIPSGLLANIALVPGRQTGILSVVCLFAGVLAGLALLIPASMGHIAFQKAHPYVQDFYTEKDRARARRTMSICLVAGIGLILLGLLGFFLFDGTAHEDTWGSAALFAGISAGVWFIVYGGMTLGRMNIAGYNKEIAENLELDDIEGLDVDEARRARLLAEGRMNRRIGVVCGAIMLAAMIASLIWLFLGVLFAGGNVSDHAAWSVAAHQPFWLPWAIGGILCGIASLLMREFGSRNG